MVPRASREDVLRLRRMAQDRTLEILFDPEECEERKVDQCWAVFYVDRHGQRVFLTSWPHTLDGNLEGLAARIRKLDRNHHDARDFEREVEDRQWRRRRMAKRRREEHNEDFAEYSANAFRAYFKDGPNATVGYVGPGCTGKA